MYKVSIIWNYESGHRLATMDFECASREEAVREAAHQVRREWLEERLFDWSRWERMDYPSSAKDAIEKMNSSWEREDYEEFLSDAELVYNKYDFGKLYVTISLVQSDLCNKVDQVTSRAKEAGADQQLLSEFRRILERGVRSIEQEREGVPGIDE